MKIKTVRVLLLVFSCLLSYNMLVGAIPAIERAALIGSIQQYQWG